MASQPANTEISVLRTFRTRVQTRRNASIKEVTQRLGDVVVMAPGEEIDTFNVIDTAGAVTPGPNPAWRYGMPVTVESRDRASVGTVVGAVSGLDFPQQIVGTRHDLFFHKTAGNLTDDLHEEVRQASPPPRGLFRAV
jgi:hypothetical protein